MEDYKFDFCGWATKNDMKCSDGRTIRKDAFKDNDGQVVPLVWQHMHDSPINVLGHALLKNREEGVYAYCTFNDTQFGQEAKELVRHGDITSLSIYANKLKQNGNKDVLHGCIREVSLVLAGANPGALIENSSLSHSGDDDEDEAVIFTGEEVELYHADDSKDDDKGEKKEMASEKTVKDVYDEMTEEQKNVVNFMIGKTIELLGKNSDKQGENMKHNVFDNEDAYMGDTLSHDDMMTIINDGKRFGSLKESFLQHADDYGIDNIEYLFPDAKAMENAPTFIKREQEWVTALMNNTHHTPFSRIKSVFADITEDDARAKGYIKGHMKKEEFFGLIKRTTTPTTVYKKQKLDRDDVIDITDFDVVAWLKTEMRMMLNEEIARAVLIGDGRMAGSDDKINESCIRPIATDNDLFTIKHRVIGEGYDNLYEALVDEAVRARKKYKGSGSPTMFTTEDTLTEMLLLRDKMGHKLYKSEAELATALRVKNIVTVPVMEGATFADPEFDAPAPILGIIVNPADYNIGADKGGSINMFDDFDIDYNQQKYLIETRCSGALTKPYSAIVLYDLFSTK